jgi:hypothetical protein
MPGPVLHVGAIGTCPHGAPLKITPGMPKVMVSGMPVATMKDAYTIAGCPFQIPVGAGTKPQPCVLVKWIPSTRVTTFGSPLVLVVGGIAQSADQIPQGPPIISTFQTRVIAT